MRNCPKCGKANQPTRKFCIRCGEKLIQPQKPKASAAPLPAPTPAPARQVSAPPQQPKGAPATTDDKWVKPSEVSRDRVRSTDSGKRKTELEKAREAFAKAETVGIDEEGTGVIETRMLRASEVKELLEGPGLMEGTEEIPQPKMMEGSEPLPPEAAEMMMPSKPSSKQIEQQILGSKSAYVEKEPEPVLDAHTVEDIPVTSEISAEFSSSKYEDASEEIHWATEETPSAGPSDIEDDLDLVIACPACGNVMNVDMFEYPREVYSAMGAARLKQARFFIVQGKSDDAARIVGVARALFSKAEDKTGLAEAKKLEDSIVKRS